jgi:phage baseplate assembly protein W
MVSVPLVVPRRTADTPPLFLGVGWAFPLAIADDGSVAVAAYEENVHQSILIILGTNYGERVMRPQFGAGLRDFVFAPLNSTTLALVKKRVGDALTDYEPRIDVLELHVTADTETVGRLLIELTYQVRSTNTRANLVYPFYLQEGST